MAHDRRGLPWLVFSLDKNSGFCRSSPNDIWNSQNNDEYAPSRTTYVGACTKERATSFGSNPFSGCHPEISGSNSPKISRFGGCLVYDGRTSDLDSDSTSSNMFYSDLANDHSVSALFVFCPDGTIPIACFNVPGCIHDRTIAEWGDVYAKLETVYSSEAKGICTAPSAFSTKRYPFLIRSRRVDPINSAPEDLELNRQATSMRQDAEWGMMSIHSSFPRLKDRLANDEIGEKKIIMKMILLLNNFRARRIGIDQIKNVYIPRLNLDANEAFIVPLL